MEDEFNKDEFNKEQCAFLIKEARGVRLFQKGPSTAKYTFYHYSRLLLLADLLDARCAWDSPLEVQQNIIEEWDKKLADMKPNALDFCIIEKNFPRR
jgi:hypothetical protein